MIRLVFFLVPVVCLMGCQLQPLLSFNSPISPVMPQQVPTIADNQWRLTEVVYNGEPGRFDGVAPVLVTFHPKRPDIDRPSLIGVSACNGLSFIFDTDNTNLDNGYRLIQGEGTARNCEYVEQEHFISDALMATNRYELVGNTLILSGDNARLTLVMDNEIIKVWPQ